MLYINTYTIELSKYYNIFLSEHNKFFSQHFKTYQNKNFHQTFCVREMEKHFHV